MATKSRHLKTPLQLWIADERKRLGLTPLDLASMTGVTEATVRAWESRGRPSADALGILERTFGKPAPGDQGAASQAVTAELVASLTAQTEALNRLAAAIEQQPNASELTMALRALADVQADQSANVQRNSDRILTLEEAIAARFDVALGEARARPAPHETTG